MKDKKHLVVVDTLGWIHRLYFNAYSVINDKGVEVGLVRRFFQNLSEVIKELEPDYFIFAMDNKGDSFRNELDKDYKANRNSMPKDLANQLRIIEEVLKDNSVNFLRKPKQEADDIIASICDKYKDEYFITVIGYDKDLYQCITKGGVRIFDPSQRQSKGYSWFKDKFGFEPSRFAQYQSLLGDGSDNVKGVAGIGAVTATKLIIEFKTLVKIYKCLHKIPTATSNKLQVGKNSAFKSLRLVKLRTDIKVPTKLFPYRAAKLERIKYRLMRLK